MSTVLDRKTTCQGPVLLTSALWEAHKPLIRDLYLIHNLSLKEVKHELADHHDFRPTTKQWKDKFQVWGFYKNLTSLELDRIVRHLENADPDVLLDSCRDRSIEYEGRQVPLCRVRRHARRSRKCQGNDASMPERARMPSANGYSTIQDMEWVYHTAKSPPHLTSYPDGSANEYDFDFAKSLMPSSTPATVGEPDFMAKWLAESTDLSLSQSSIAEESSRRGNEPYSAKLFACPYFKRNPLKYSARNTTELIYRSCATVVLRNTAQTKQHLYRVHKRPDHFCEKCFLKFEKTTDLNAHMSARNCTFDEEPSIFRGKMDEDQYKRIRKRQTRADQQDGWYEIYTILFPDSPRPASPYVEGDDNQESVQHLLNIFRSLGPGSAGDLYAALTRSVLAQPLPSTTNIVVEEAYNSMRRQWLEECGEHPVLDLMLTSSTYTSQSSTRKTSASYDANDMWFEDVSAEPESYGATEEAIKAEDEHNLDPFLSTNWSDVEDGLLMGLGKFEQDEFLMSLPCK